VAKLIYEASQSRLTQQQLADLSGTKQPVIARLEDADYEGHSLSMQRIAHALNQRLKSISPPLSDRAKRSHKGNSAAAFYRSTNLGYSWLQLELTQNKYELLLPKLLIFQVTSPTF